MIYAQLSDWKYDHKPMDKAEKERISGGKHFHYKELTEEFFLQALRDGHGFCPLPRYQAQADQAKTNIVVYDFDYNTTPLPAFVEGLALKPAYAYYSYSNGKWGLHRCRLIFELSSPIAGNQYDEVHHYIATANHWRKTPPHKKDVPPTPEMLNTFDGLARNQYFFSGTGISYNPENVINYAQPAQPREHHQPAPKPAPAPTTARHQPRQTKPQADTTTTYFTDDFKKNFGRLSPHAFTQLTAEGSVYYATHTPLPMVDADTPTIQYPKDYIETPRRLFWDGANHTHFVKKWTDGEARHRKIYMAGIILRKLNPQLSPDELLFAVCQEFATYYSNDDNKYTTADLIHIVECVLSADTGRELGKWKRKGYIVNGIYCEKHGTSKRAVVGQQNGIRQAAERAKRYEDISKYYDPTETDNTNLLRLKQKGIQCSLRTLKRYKVDYGYTEPTQAPHKAEPTPKPKAKPTPKEKHPTPPRETPHQPTMTPNYAFDRMTDTETIESIKKMLRRGLNNSSTIN